MTTAETPARERFVDAALAGRIERAWMEVAELSAQAAARRPSALPGITWERFEPAGGAAFFGQGSPLSQAQGLGFGAEGAEAVDPAILDRLDAFFDSRGAAAAIEVSTLADPGLLPALAARGYRPAEVTHMLIQPIEPGTIEAEPSRPTVHVRQVDRADATTRAACAQAVLGGFFEGPDEPPPGMSDLFDQMAAADSASAWYAQCGPDLAPAGGAMLFVHSPIALFAGDATLPALRRRGVQSALIHARLAEAARLGCTLAVACTQPGTISQRNYQRQGFQLAYARVLMTREPRPRG